MHFFENHLSTFMHMKSAIKIAIFYIDILSLCMSGMRKLKSFIANIIVKSLFPYTNVRETEDLPWVRKKILWELWFKFFFKSDLITSLLFADPPPLRKEGGNPTDLNLAMKIAEEVLPVMMVPPEWIPMVSSTQTGTKFAKTLTIWICAKNCCAAFMLMVLKNLLQFNNGLSVCI